MLQRIDVVRHARVSVDEVHETLMQDRDLLEMDIEVFQRLGFEISELVILVGPSIEPGRSQLVEASVMPRMVVLP